MVTEAAEGPPLQYPTQNHFKVVKSSATSMTMTMTMTMIDCTVVVSEEDVPWDDADDAVVLEYAKYV